MSGDRVLDADIREYPGRPIVGVAGIVLRDRKVLLIQRGREPMKGAWSLPGGALQVGERVPEGIAREVKEETGVRVRTVELVEVLDRISHDRAGRVQYHYVLLDWLCVPQAAELDTMSTTLTAGSDAQAVVWADLAALATFELEHVTVRVIERAAKRAMELGL